MSRPTADATTFDRLRNAREVLALIDVERANAIELRSMLVHDLLARGFTLAEIAEGVGVHRSTVHQWKRTP